MEQYDDEVIDSIAERLTQFKGRMLFFDERQEVAREMVAKNLFDASRLIETINRFSGDNKKSGWSGYVSFCVNWLSQTDKPAEKLLTIALDTKMFWHVRREAFKCIGDLPSKESLGQKQWEQVANAIRPQEKESEWHQDEPLWAIVDLGVTSVYPILHSMLESHLQNLANASPEELHEHKYEWSNATRRLKLATAVLGNNELVPYVIEQLFSVRQYDEREAKRAFKQVESRFGGVDRVAKELLQQEEIEFKADDVWSPMAQHSNPAVVRWSMLQIPKDHPAYESNLLSQLSNPDWGIREEACKLIQRFSENNDSFAPKPLWDMLSNEANNQVTRSWAGRALLNFGVSIDEIFPIDSREKDKELWYVPWPFEADSAVRRAIVSEYGGYYTFETDIRYKLESEMYERYEKEDATSDRESLLTALRTGGIKVANVQSAGDFYAQGWGTYWIIRLGDERDSSEIFVSTLGPIVSFNRVHRYKAKYSKGSSWTVGETVEGFKKEAQKTEKQRVEEIARQVGFSIVEKDLLEKVPPGLNFKFFSNFGPQEINDLIYYWVS